MVVFCVIINFNKYFKLLGLSNIKQVILVDDKEYKKLLIIIENY